MTAEFEKIKVLLFDFICGELAPVNFLDQYQDLFDALNEKEIPSGLYELLELFDDALEYYVPDPEVRKEIKQYFGPEKLYTLATKLYDQIGKK